MLSAAACTTTKSEINSFKKSGKCRMAENLIMEEYSGQKQLYNVAMVYIECDGEKSKGLKILKTLASGEYMPAMARLIELNAASSQMIKRYNILQSAAEQAAYERRQASKQRLLNYGRTTRTVSSGSNRPTGIDNRCIQDGGTQMCYNRQSQRYGNSSSSSGISSPYSGVSGQSGISGMSSPYD
jgi:hypothetical protein